MSQHAEGPPIAEVAQMMVAFEPSEHGLPLAGCDGDGRSAGVAATRPGIPIAVRVISELSERPGAEDDAKSGKTAQDLGVRVLLKMASQLGLERGDLAVELADDRHRGANDRAEGICECAGRLELWRAQCGLDLLCSLLHVMPSPTTSQTCGDRRERQPSSFGGCRRTAQHPQGVGMGEIVAERHQSRGIELAQARPQRVHLTLAGPDLPLMSAGEDLDRFCE